MGVSHFQLDIMIFFSITLWACTFHIIEGAAVAVNQVIDLTHDVANGYTLQWPTAQEFKFNVGFRGVTEGGFYYEGNDFSQAEHSGTHTDAPAHFAKVSTQHFTERHFLLLKLREVTLEKFVLLAHF